MALIFQKLWSGYKMLFHDLSHPRTRGWFLVQSPVPLIAIVGSYLYFCFRLGPRIMKNRQPYELKRTLLVYNIAQMCASAYIFYEGAVNAWLSHYSFTCQPIDDFDDPKEIMVSELVYWYFINKITELMDTVFFVLRKKDNQITSLHLYHHTIMPIATWIAVKYAPGGHCTLIGWLNSFVHVIMYGYYLVAGLGPQYQKYLWWKKHLTTMQLVQFVILFWHNFSVLFRECEYPKFYNVLGVIQSSLFLYLFGQFYYRSYIKGKNKSVKEN